MKVILPAIKNAHPSVIASDIVGVQPMTEEPEYKMNLRYGEGPGWQPGDIIHSFVEGWGIIDNDNEFVPIDEFAARPVDVEITSI